MIYNDTPVHEIKNHITDRAGVRLLIKREDLNHQWISGNKWWKLKHNISQALYEHKETVLTFGGAYSNHIYAVAAAARKHNLKSIGVIRGEETLPLNPTISFALSQGMQVHYISRADYRKKEDANFIKKLREQFQDFYLIPEGGTNSLAVKGCEEFTTQKLQPLKFDYVCLAVGTGGTMAGIISGLEGERNVVGIPVLKNSDFLREQIIKLLQQAGNKTYNNWSLLTSYHHGGYAKVTKPLIEFITSMHDQHHIPLDSVYTGKMMWAVMHEIELGRFPRGSTILALHTGGLQGTDTQNCNVN